MPKVSPKPTPPAMILCGNKGARLRDVSERRFMRTCAAFGVNRFILCLGYKNEKFINCFLNFHVHTTEAAT